MPVSASVFDPRIGTLRFRVFKKPGNYGWVFTEYASTYDEAHSLALSISKQQGVPTCVVECHTMILPPPKNEVTEVPWDKPV